MPPPTPAELAAGLAELGALVTEWPEGHDREDALVRLRDLYRQARRGERIRSSYLISFAAAHGSTPAGVVAHRILDRLGY